MDNFKLKLLILKTGDKFFVTDNIEGKSYFNSVLYQYYFDGKPSLPSFKESWRSIEKIPEKIQFKTNKRGINYRYELDINLNSKFYDKLPKVLSVDEASEVQDDIIGLYKYVCDYIDGELTDVEFEYEIVCEDENFQVVKPKYKYTSNIITQLTTHIDLRINRPCSIPSKDLYTVVREHVKLNINPKNAVITSDYDFCFTVKKIIKLTKEVIVEENKGTDKRPKWEKRFLNTRLVEVFEMAPAPYRKYTVISPIHGKNYKDLEENITKYLDDLITMINEPLVDCPHCNGEGVILSI